MSSSQNGGARTRSEHLPTLSDVAKLAGVSVKTVSRTLNNEGNVRPEKVERVLRAAEELGFRRNEMARLLRTRGSAAMIGVITADVGDPFWTGVLRGVEVTIDVGERFILSVSTRDNSERESEIVSAMLERRVMALLVVPTASDQSYLRRITAQGTPVVCVDRPATGADVDAVIADDVGGAQRGVGLLLDRGHRRIAFFGRPSVYTTRKRVQGYRNALIEAGVPIDEQLIYTSLDEPSTVAPVVDRLLALDDPPTAVFTSNVSTSLGLLTVMKSTGWKPGMVAFSDFDAASICDPMVTVVHNDPVLLGQRAAELALERLDGYDGPARTVQIETPIIERESHEVQAR